MAACGVDVCGMCLEKIDLIKERSLNCRGNCGKRYHKNCTKISEKQFKLYTENKTYKWCCKNCKIISEVKDKNKTIIQIIIILSLNLSVIHKHKTLIKLIVIILLYPRIMKVIMIK